MICVLNAFRVRSIIINRLSQPKITKSWVHQFCNFYSVAKMQTAAYLTNNLAFLKLCFSNKFQIKYFLVLFYYCSIYFCGMWSIEVWVIWNFLKLFHTAVCQEIQADKLQQLQCTYIYIRNKINPKMNWTLSFSVFFMRFLHGSISHLFLNVLNRFKIIGEKFLTFFIPTSFSGSYCNIWCLFYSLFLYSYILTFFVSHLISFALFSAVLFH